MTRTLVFLSVRVYIAAFFIFLYPKTYAKVSAESVIRISEPLLVSISTIQSKGQVLTKEIFFSIYRSRLLRITILQNWFPSWFRVFWFLQMQIDFWISRNIITSFLVYWIYFRKFIICFFIMIWSRIQIYIIGIQKVYNHGQSENYLLWNLYSYLFFHSHLLFYLHKGNSLQ